MELTYRNALIYGWMKLKGWWKVMAAYGLVMVLFQVLINIIANYGEALGALLTLPLSFLFSLVNAAFMLFMVDSGDQAGDAIEELKRFWEYLKTKLGLILRFLGLQVVTGLVMMALLLGLVLVAAIPAVIGMATGSGVTGVFLALTVVLGIVAFVVFVAVSIRLQWAQFVMIDEMGGIRESIRRSWEMTQGRVLWMMGWGFVVLLLMLVGLLALLVGAIVVMLVSTVATGWIYRMMAGNVKPGRVAEAKKMPMQPMESTESAMPEMI